MQGFIEPIPTAISGKDTPCAVAAVSGWRKAQDVESGIGISETWKRLPPVRPIAELAPLSRGDGFPVGHQPGAACAGHDVGVKN